MTKISDARLARVKAIANIVALRMDMGSTPEAIAEHILSALEASPAPVSEEMRFDAMFAALEAADAKGQTSHDPLQDRVNKTFAAIDAYRAALAAKGGQ